MDMTMGGRFGKYGDNKRLKALQRSRREKSRLQGAAAKTVNRRAFSSHHARVLDQPLAPAAKTHQSAVVIIPPLEIWEPIQEIRREHDRHYRRWMPHITLVYPFRPHSEFEPMIPKLVQACRTLAPFDIRLARFGCFGQRRENAALFLIPEPTDRLITLQTLILTVVPDCDDVCRFPGGFMPHLSLGQIRGGRARTLCTEWQNMWQPLSFTATHACLIWRNDPPDDIFRSGPAVPLGG